MLAKRRGHVTADVPKPGTPIFIVKVRCSFLSLSECSAFGVLCAPIFIVKVRPETLYFLGRKRLLHTSSGAQ